MKCTHTYHVSQVTSNIFMTNFMLEPGSLLHLGNCHLCNSTQKWMENSGCSVSCAMLPFYLRGLTPAEAHIERICIFSSHPQGSWLLTIHSKASQAFRLRPCSPWTALGAVKFTWAFHLLCRLPKYFQDQITGLRRNLSNSNREMRNAQAVRRWQLGDVNVNFGVYFATSTLLISSGLRPSLVKCSNLQQKHSWWALYSVCLIIHARWKLYRQD